MSDAVCFAMNRCYLWFVHSPCDTHKRSGIFSRAVEVAFIVDRVDGCGFENNLTYSMRLGV